MLLDVTVYTVVTMLVRDIEEIEGSKRGGLRIKRAFEDDGVETDGRVVDRCQQPR